MFLLAESLQKWQSQVANLKSFAPLAHLAEQVTLNDRPCEAHGPTLPNTLRNFGRRDAQHPLIVGPANFQSRCAAFEVMTDSLQTGQNIMNLKTAT